MALQWHKVIKYDPENKILMLAAEPGIWKSDRGMVFTPETPTDTESVPETTDVQKWKSKGKGCGASQPAAGKPRMPMAAAFPSGGDPQHRAKKCNRTTEEVAAGGGAILVSRIQLPMPPQMQCTLHGVQGKTVDPSFIAH